MAKERKLLGIISVITIHRIKELHKMLYQPGYEKQCKALCDSYAGLYGDWITAAE